MYQKEIIYMGLYRNGSRLGSAGFLKVENKDAQGKLFLKLQNIPPAINGRFPVRIYNGTEWKEMSGVSVRDGAGVWEEGISGASEKVRLQIILSEGYLIEGQSKSSEHKAANPEPEMEYVIPMEAKREIKTEEMVMKAETPGRAMPGGAETIKTENTEIEMPQPCNVKEDKWEQILSAYEQIHPYGDDRVYVKLEPKDFIILQSKYQHLVNNSFLLHGFYNYRYVILGKEDDYYLGVPGVYYKREKMVALMFGFEAFECENGVAEEGKFGYYLRKVEL